MNRDFLHVVQIALGMMSSIFIVVVYARSLEGPGSSGPTHEVRTIEYRTMNVVERKSLTLVGVDQKRSNP